MWDVFQIEDFSTSWKFHLSFSLLIFLHIFGVDDIEEEEVFYDAEEDANDDDAVMNDDDDVSMTNSDQGN